jgi:short-subunit dehydrogenase
MILVTGASQGIGYACVRALLDRTSARVVMTGRSADTLAVARFGIAESQRERLETRVCDQGDRRDVDALSGWLAGADEPLDGAILTVGANPMYVEGPRRIHALSAATIEATIRTNCTHTTMITATVLDRFRRQRRGVLVWIGSQAARVGLPGAGLYGGTKSFLSGLASAAHNEYSGRGVRVHLLHPGIVRTPRTAAVADGFAARHGQTVADPADVARQIVDVFESGDPSAVEMNLC